MKKKYPPTIKDQEDWIAFTKQKERIYDKDEGFVIQNNELHRIRKLDLHGFPLDKANKVVKKFINESFEDNYKKLLIITGKGLRSKVYNNPYQSQEMNVLKNSVPEFIMNDEDLFNKITKISKASIQDGGDGAFYIFLK